MTSFFNWRVLTYNLPSDRPIQLQRSVAVDREQLIYALTWSNSESVLRSLKSASALDSTTPFAKATDLLRPHRPIWTGPTLRVHRIPFKALSGASAVSYEASPLTMKKTRSTILREDTSILATESRAEYEILEYICSKDPHVPSVHRQLMVQAATVETDSGSDVVIVVLNSHRAYIFNTKSREWLEPIEISDEPLLLRQFIFLRDSQLFIQYHSKGGWPQFAVLDVARKTVRNPLRIPALPRSHGLTFFVSQHSNTLNVIVDRWPRCSREWWSLALDSVLLSGVDRPSILECTHVLSEPIDLHFSDFIPVGNRWIIGVDGSRWKYHDYEENLIPHQINYIDGQKPGSSSTMTVIDKCNESVQKFKALTKRPSDDELPAATCSPGFYVPFKTTEVVTLELPAMLSQVTGQLVLRVWGSSLSRLPPDIDAIWKYLSLNKIDDLVVARILSFMLT